MRLTYLSSELDEAGIALLHLLYCTLDVGVYAGPHYITNCDVFDMFIHRLLGRVSLLAVSTDPVNPQIGSTRVEWMP